MPLIDKERYTPSHADQQSDTQKSDSGNKEKSVDIQKSDVRASQNTFQVVRGRRNTAHNIDPPPIISENEVEVKEKFTWQMLRSIIQEGKLNGNREGLAKPEGENNKSQSDLMLQIAKSLAKVANIKSVDYQKMNEKQDHRNMLWNDPESVWIKVALNMSDIASTSLQFCVWAYKTTEDKKLNKITFESKIVGETYINLSTMFKDHSNDQFGRQKKPKEFNTKLWLHGICVGNVKGVIEVETSPYLRQLVCGVLTELGLAKSSIVLMKDEEEEKSKLNMTLNPKLKRLNETKDELISSVYLHLGKTKEKKGNVKVTIGHIKKQLEIIKAELERSDKHSMVSFIYQYKGEMYRAQELFIELGKHLSDFCDEIDEDMKELYFRDTLNVLDRGELSLDSMGFSDKQKEQIKEQGAENCFKKGTVKIKLKVSLEYQRLLYDCLFISLNILSQKVHFSDVGPSEIRERLHRILFCLCVLQNS